MYNIHIIEYLGMTGRPHSLFLRQILCLLCLNEFLYQSHESRQMKGIQKLEPLQLHIRRLWSETCPLWCPLSLHEGVGTRHLEEWELLPLAVNSFLQCILLSIEWLMVAISVVGRLLLNLK